MELISSGKLAIDFIAWSTSAGSGWISPLDHKIGDYAMEDQSIVIALFGKGHEIFNSVGGIVVVELDFHHPFFGVDFSRSHEGNVK